MANFRQLCYTTPLDINDRDNILFPGRINGRYALLRRPEEYTGEKYGTDVPSLWISYSNDLLNWDEPELVAKPEAAWEGRDFVYLLWLCS